MGWEFSRWLLSKWLFWLCYVNDAIKEDQGDPGKSKGSLGGKKGAIRNLQSNPGCEYRSIIKLKSSTCDYLKQGLKNVLSLFWMTLVIMNTKLSTWLWATRHRRICFLFIFESPPSASPNPVPSRVTGILIGD